ncbi:MAG: hypothetical protein IT462_02885 [Planctomycetes bacterium]|nr:hypothetical protein [Planctomycetota bacterium]
MWRRPRRENAMKEELDRAYKAFKKRLKIYQNDAYSSSPAAQLSGNKPTICGITPPDGFPPEVWDELVAKGKLKKSGRLTYELANPK